MSDKNYNADYRSKIKIDRFYSSNQEESLASATEKDRFSIVHTSALRRLQQKTQVYPLESNASVRSRLTHSIEVQQIGRMLAKNILATLQLEKEVEIAFLNTVEMACLLHDIGNPPFGHFGEYVLSKWLKNNLLPLHQQAVLKGASQNDFFETVLFPDLCNFDGNAQGLRILHHLQSLDLTLTQIASLIKYPRAAYAFSQNQDKQNYYRSKKPGYFFSEADLFNRMSQLFALDLKSRHPLSYIMEAADDIAYCISDLEDSVDKGIFSIKALDNNLRTICSQVVADKKSDYFIKVLNNLNLNAPLDYIKKLREQLVHDAVNGITEVYLTNHEAILKGQRDEPLILGNKDTFFALDTLRLTAIQHVFNNQDKYNQEIKGYRAMNELLNWFSGLLSLTWSEFDQLFQPLSDHFGLEKRIFQRLPSKYLQAYDQAVTQIKNSQASKVDQANLEWYYRVRLIIDYLTGMTDNFLLDEYHLLSGF